MKQANATLGVLVAPRLQSAAERDGGAQIPEERLCRALSAYAPEYGLRVVVFSGADFDLAAGKLSGWQLQGQRWHYSEVPLPDLLYDRCFCSSADERAASRQGLAALSRAHSWIRLGGALPGKLTVSRWLRQAPALRPYVPLCAPLYQPDQLSEGLHRHPEGLFLKPDGGMQGKGAIKLTPCEGGQLRIEGRSRTNRPFALVRPLAEGLERVWRLAAGSRYLLQPYLTLSDQADRPFDIRVLVQKDGRGRWMTTGSALRRGDSGSITSNLHGGGEALPTRQSLSALIGPADAEQRLRELREVSLQTADLLEQRAGRLLELGLDYGLDRSGRLWLLEANSKPGRKIFALTDNLEAGERSIRRPLQYARNLVDRHASRGNNYQEVHS